MHDHLSDRELLVLILERLSFVHDHQHTIIKEIHAMSGNQDAQFTVLVGLVDDLKTSLGTLGTALDKEIQQVIDAQAGGGTGASPANMAKVQSAIDGLNTISDTIKAMATKLAADDPTAPTFVDPAALASAVAAARAAGATDVQLQAVVALGDGVSPQITKAMLKDAMAAAQVAAGDGSAPATAAQLAALIALST